MVAGDGIYVCLMEAAYFAKIDDIVANNYGDAEHVMQKYKSTRHDDVRVVIPVEAPVQHVYKFYTDPPCVNGQERQVCVIQTPEGKYMQNVDNPLLLAMAAANGDTPAVSMLLGPGVQQSWRI